VQVDVARMRLLSLFISSLVRWIWVLAHIAQSVEHFLGKEEVTGSNPVVGSS
jgi:hypothetical protein